MYASLAQAREKADTAFGGTTDHMKTGDERRIDKVRGRIVDHLEFDAVVAFQLSFLFFPRH